MGTSVIGLIGLYGGMICGILGWWFGRKKAKKNRGLDELYEHIWQKARSYSWYVTLVAIYILFSLILFGFDMNVAMVLGVIMLVHLSSWAIIGIGFSIAMQSEEPIQPNNIFIGVSTIIIFVLTFTIIAVEMGDWRFILIGIPISLLGLLFALKPKKKIE